MQQLISHCLAKRLAPLLLAVLLTVVCVGTFPELNRAAGQSGGKRSIPGPVQARVLRIIDGDTVAVRAAIWPGQHIDVSVRLADVDAPELRNRCKSVRDRAWRARNLLHNLIAGTTISLHDIRHGKYAGRVIAQARTFDGLLIAEHLIKAGVAQPYSARRKSRRRAASACDTTVVLARKP